MNTLASSNAGKPADFMGSIQSFFTSLAKNSRALVVGLVILALVGAGLALFLNKKEGESEEARNALFLAQQSVDSQIKALGDKEQLMNAVKDVKAEKAGAQVPPPKGADIEALSYKKLDVDAEFKDAISKFTAVSEKYSGTRPAFEARLYLGNLYYNHGESEKALPWYTRAVDSASGSMEKAFAYSALGYAQENAGKNQDALDSFDKALNQGEGMIKGDVLLAIARNQTKLGKSADAQATYDRIVKELADTEFSKTAENLKAQAK
jgi:tetratricopeptide (TPR) repeat protein